MSDDANDSIVCPAPYLNRRTLVARLESAVDIICIV
jgi:hypothetical protein